MRADDDLAGTGIGGQRWSANIGAPSGWAGPPGPTGTRRIVAPECRSAARHCQTVGVRPVTRLPPPCPARPERPVDRRPRHRAGPRLQPMWSDRVAIAVAGAIGLTLLAAARWQLRWLPVVVLVLCGIALRLSVMGKEASDVADVTSNAIQMMGAGFDPYGIGYMTSRPMGAAFPYGPVALLWYLPFRSRSGDARVPRVGRARCATSASAPRTAGRSGSRSSPSRRRSCSRRWTGRTTRAPGCSSSRRVALGVRRPAAGRGCPRRRGGVQAVCGRLAAGVPRVGRAAGAPRLRRRVARRVGDRCSSSGASSRT